MNDFLIRVVSNEGFSQEMPHFGLESLSSKYGVRLTLDYLYYLGQGRPSFALKAYLESLGGEAKLLRQR